MIGIVFFWRSRWICSGNWSRRSGAEGGGVASAMMMTLRTAGAMFGVAVFGTIAMQAIAGPAAGPALTMVSGQLVPGIQAAFLAGAVICLAGAIISLSIPEPAIAPAPE